MLTVHCDVCGQTMAAPAADAPTELTSVCTDCLAAELGDTDLADTALYVEADDEFDRFVDDAIALTDPGPDDDDTDLVRIFREAGLGHFLEDLGGSD